MKPITLRYSEALIRNAVKAFWWRETGWSFFIPLVFLGGYFAFRVGSGDRSWKIGLFGGVAVLGAVFAIALYLIHYRRSIGRLQRMRVPEATLELGEDRFRMTTDVGSTELVWTAVTELWCSKDFWMVFISKAQFMTLPAADLDPAAREFILAKLKANGIKIT